ACALEPAMRADARPYHHTATGFRNPPGSPAREAGFGDMVSFIWRRFNSDKNPPAVPPGHVVEEAQALARLAELEGHDTLTWLGHAAFLIRTPRQTILTDPYLSDYASQLSIAGPRRFVAPVIGISKLPPIDILILSHNHYDHLDIRTLDALPGKERMVVIAPLKLGAYFLERGWRDVRELDWHDTTDIGEVTVTALPAIHFSRRTPFDTNKSLWMSVAISSPTQRLFFSGDTALGPVFRDIGARYGPFSAALIGIGAYLPRVIMKATHSTPEEAVRLGLEVGAHRLVAMHWGTVVLTDEPPFEPPGRFAAAARAAGFDDERAWLMKIGESRVLPREWPRN
ncbi:MAG: MBL fold metallo-hydrolase, partial [Alphaproteobacteria bacterium]